MDEKKIVLEIKQPQTLILFLFLILVLFLELQLTLRSPIAFGDEGFYTNIGRWIAKEKEYPVWARGIGTNLLKVGFSKVPLWVMIQGGFYFIFGFSEIIVKILTPFLLFLTGLAVYLLVKKIYSSTVALVAAILTVTIPSFVTYSVLFYPETSFTFFISLAILIMLLAVKTGRKKYWLLTGIFSSLTILTDTPGIVLIPFFGICFLYQLFKKRNFFNVAKNWMIVAALIILFILPYVLRNYYFYKTPSCQLPLSIFSTSGCDIRENYKNTYNFEGSLAEGGTASPLIKFGILSYLDFAYGFTHSNEFINFIGIAFIPLTFICGLITLFYKRSEIEALILFVLFVFIIIFYQSLTGRVEDMARNMIGLTAIVALISAVYFGEVIEFTKKYHKIFPLVIIGIVLIVAFFNFKYKLDTMYSVKQFSPLFFEACDWVKENTPKDSILLSFHTSPTYYNCERQAQWDLPDSADIILSQNVNLTLARLKANGITHIFVQKFSIISQKFSAGYWIGFVQFLDSNQEKFKKAYENGPDLQTCLSQGGCDGSIIYEVIDG